MGTYYEDLHTHITVSYPFLLRMRNVSNKSCGENQDIHFMFHNFFLIINGAVHEIRQKDVVEPDRPQMTIYDVSWVTKAHNM